MKFLRFIGVLLGLGLLTALIQEVGWSSIRETLGWLGWSYVLILAYPLSWFWFNTLGWWYACHPRSAGIQLSKMMAIRLAGETFNSLLPSGYVGGEPVKAKLFSAWTSLREASSSVLVAKCAQSIGLLFYIGLGLALGMPPGASPELRMKAWIALGLLSVGIAIFTLLLARQSFSRFGAWAHRLIPWKWILNQQPRLSALDESLGAFYRECKGRFAASVFWHGLGWVAGMLELYIIFQLIGTPLSLKQAWFMGAMAQLAAVIGLISPGGLGFYEGGHYVAATLLGLPPTLGVSASLIRRVREVFWNGVGLYFFWRYSKKKN